MGIQYTVKIQLDKIRKLKLDLNAMAIFEETAGLSCFDQVTWEKMSARTVRALLWAALLHEDSTLTLTDVGGFVSMENLEYVTGKLMEAWQKAAPKAEGEKGGQSPPSPSSGQSESMTSD